MLLLPLHLNYFVLYKVLIVHYPWLVDSAEVYPQLSLASTKSHFYSNFSLSINDCLIVFLRMCFLAQTFKFLHLCASPWARTHITSHCCALILPPDCPNKPKQTAGRQRRDVTHSFEPWRLSAWRRAGGLYSNNKQQASIPPLSPIHLRAAESWEQTGQRSFIT